LCFEPLQISTLGVAFELVWMGLLTLISDRYIEIRCRGETY